MVTVIGIVKLSTVVFVFICVVGYGVFVTHSVSKGDFIGEYCGDLLTGRGQT